MINLWSYKHGAFTLGNSLFGAIKLTENSNTDKYFYSGLPDGSGFVKNVIIVGADMTSSVHIDHKKKDILILGKGQTNG